jgi:hypothetical protein
MWRHQYKNYSLYFGRGNIWNESLKIEQENSSEKKEEDILRKERTCEKVEYTRWAVTYWNVITMFVMTGKTGLKQHEDEEVVEEIEVKFWVLHFELYFLGFYVHVLGVMAKFSTHGFSIMYKFHWKNHYILQQTNPI